MMTVFFLVLITFYVSIAVYVIYILFLFSFTIESRFPFHENTSSDSEEEILRRLKLAQSQSAHSGGRYNGTGLTHNLANYSGFQNITLATKNAPFDTTTNVEHKKSSRHKERSHHHHHHHRRHSDKHNDPLGLAERGRIGVPHSSSDCSSNSSVEASVESNAGLVNGEIKGKCVFDVF